MASRYTSSNLRWLHARAQTGLTTVHPEEIKVMLL